MNKDTKFTFIRNLPGESDERADGVLFASQEFIGDSDLEAALKDKDVLACFDPNKPVMALRYHKDEDQKNGWDEEWRVVVTQLRFYVMPMNDAHGHVSVATLNGAGKVDIVKYQEKLDGCVELFRLNGCQDCPKKGLQCIDQNLGGRPWYFEFAFNRKYDEWCKDLCADGNILKRRDENEKFLLSFENLQKTEAFLKKNPLLGAEFVHPDKTRSGEFGMMTHPLRPCRDHRFFKKASTTAKTKAA